MMSLLTTVSQSTDTETHTHIHRCTLAQTKPLARTGMLTISPTERKLILSAAALFVFH